MPESAELAQVSLAAPLFESYAQYIEPSLRMHVAETQRSLDAIYDTETPMYTKALDECRFRCDDAKADILVSIRSYLERHIAVPLEPDTVIYTVGCRANNLLRLPALDGTDAADDFEITEQPVAYLFDTLAEHPDVANAKALVHYAARQEVEELLQRTTDKIAADAALPQDIDARFHAALGRSLRAAISSAANEARLTAAAQLDKSDATRKFLDCVAGALLKGNPTTDDYAPYNVYDKAVRSALWYHKAAAREIAKSDGVGEQLVDAIFGDALLLRVYNRAASVFEQYGIDLDAVRTTALMPETTKISFTIKEKSAGQNAIDFLVENGYSADQAVIELYGSTDYGGNKYIRSLAAQLRRQKLHQAEQAQRRSIALLLGQTVTKQAPTA